MEREGQLGAGRRPSGRTRVSRSIRARGGLRLVTLLDFIQLSAHEACLSSHSRSSSSGKAKTWSESLGFRRCPAVPGTTARPRCPGPDLPHCEVKMPPVPSKTGVEDVLGNAQHGARRAAEAASRARSDSTPLGGLPSPLQPTTRASCSRFSP